MAAIKIILLLAITMALSITLVTVKRVGTHDQEEEDTWPNQEQQPMKDNNLVLPSQRVSRFLAETKNPRAADHCHKDNDKCASVPAAEGGGKNTTCCNNKCMNLSEDKHNCGACKKKCKYTQECCRGQCVDTDYDKRHCGGCNHRCKVGQYCVYGLCDYA